MSVTKQSIIFSLSYIKDSPADKAAVIKRFDSTYRYPVTRFTAISHIEHEFPAAQYTVHGDA